MNLMNLRTSQVKYSALLLTISCMPFFSIVATLPFPAPKQQYKTTAKRTKSKPHKLKASQRYDAHIQYFPNLQTKKRTFLSSFKKTDEKTLISSLKTTLSSWAEKLQRWNRKKLSHHQGLKNWSGSHCYMNATFQALAHCPTFMSTPYTCEPFSIYSGFFDFLLVVNANNKLGTHCDLQNFDVQQQELQMHLTNNCFGLNQLYQQQDAHEFLTQLFGKIDKNHQDVLTCLSVNQLTCNLCHSQRNTNPEASSMLQLDLPVQSDVITLHSCINTHYAKETVTVHCPRCNANQPHDKQKINLTVPKTLVIQLKRFQQQHDIQKNETPIHLNGEIALPHPDHDGSKATYMLKSVILHSGTLKGGHYVALVHEDKGWLLYNDAMVLDGAQAIQNIITTGKHDSFLPYLCFYECN